MIGSTRLVIDTNRYADLDAGVRDVVMRVETAAEVWVPLVVLAELRSGFAGGSRRKSNEQQLTAFLAIPQVGVLIPDEETTVYYANIFGKLRRIGAPIPVHDIWIAAQALQHNLTLDTRDEHFRKVPGLKLWKA